MREDGCADMSSGETSKIAARKTLAERVWPHLVALWIAGVILVFLIVRVAGSKMADAILQRVGLH
jgi:hypothetical protein